MKFKVLFVDDEPNVTSSLRRILRRHARHIEPLFANSVDDALDILANTERIEALVSDVNMPGRDGLDLLSTVRVWPELELLPVVMLTGNAQSDLKRKALDLGATDLLNKPVEPEDLVARLNSVVRMRRQAEQLQRYGQEMKKLVRDRTQALERSRIELVWRLGLAGECRDNETGNHIIRVGHMARSVAAALGQSDEYCEWLFVAAPLHDIGKIGIPDSILLKPGKLNEEEWQVMKTHTVIGANILKRRFSDRRLLTRLGLMNNDTADADINPLIEMAARIAEYHHERWDGRGYQQGLAGEEIPLEARITTLVDVYDALCSKRPYKEPIAEPKVVEMIRENVGKQFDPTLFDLMISLREEFSAIRDEYSDTKDEHDPMDIAADIIRIEAANKASTTAEDSSEGPDAPAQDEPDTAEAKTA